MYTHKGQSLVEMAIITPILLILLIGVFEVGIALRTYLVLVNANREAARFAIRPDYIDLKQPEYEKIGYMDVYRRVHDATEQQVFMDFNNNSKMVINVIDIDTGFPCDPEKREPPKYYKKEGPDASWQVVNKDQVYEPLDNWPIFMIDYWPNCDCEVVATTPYTPYIITNSMNNINYGWALPHDTKTRLNIQALSNKLAVDNDVHNCLAMKKSNNVTASQNTVVIVELHYTHKQVFGVPLLSNPLTDPIHMYTHTAMRKLPFRESPYESGEYGN